MASTLAHKYPPRTKRTDAPLKIVPPVAPRVRTNPKGGRPTDPLILAFEGDLEGLVACENDLDAIVFGLELLQKYDSVGTIQTEKLCYSDGSYADQRRIRALRKIKIRLYSHLQARASRLRSKIIPELQSIVTSVDHELTERGRFS